MRLGGFSEASRVRAMMRALKEQPVADQQGRIREPKNEIVIHFAGPSHSRLTPSSLVDDYFKAVSREKRVRSGKALLKGLAGVSTLRYELDERELLWLIRDAKTRLDIGTGYRDTTWHDIIVLLLLVRLYPPGTKDGVFAQHHLFNLAKSYPGIESRYGALMSKA